MHVRAALLVVPLLLGACAVGGSSRDRWMIPDIVETPLPPAADPSQKMVRVEVETWLVEQRVRRELGVRFAGARVAGGSPDFHYYAGGVHFLASVHASFETSRTRTRSTAFVTTLVETEGRVAVGDILPFVTFWHHGVDVTLERVERGIAVVPSYVSDDRIRVALSHVFEEAPRGAAPGRSLRADTDVVLPDGGALVVARGASTTARSFASAFLAAGDEHTGGEYVIVLRARYLN